MSLGQYKGWINQSWLDESQKKQLGWVAPDKPRARNDLFTGFTALPDPLEPQPNAEVKLRLNRPDGALLKTCRLRIQTSLVGPWLEVPTSVGAASQGSIELAIGKFDRATPVSYRVDVELEDGQRAELWGYFQVRESPDRFPVPPQSTLPTESSPAPRIEAATTPSPSGGSRDLLALFSDPKSIELNSVLGDWEFDGRVLTSPKVFGARIELPTQEKLPESYELIVVVEPLDEPNGLILGQCMAQNRFLALINFRAGRDRTVSALENVDGQNFDGGPTTVEGVQLKINQLSQIVVRVQKNSVTVDCDGRNLIRWTGEANQLSLSEYWSTKHADKLFLGAYDCRYRFHRATLTPLKN